MLVFKIFANWFKGTVLRIRVFSASFSSPGTSLLRWCIESAHQRIRRPSAHIIQVVYESRRDISSFHFKSCRKRLHVADGVHAPEEHPLKNISDNSFFPCNSLMSRWVSSEAGCTQATLFTWETLFFPVPSFLIGSGDKISARVRSQLSLNEAIIEQ